MNGKTVGEGDRAREMRVVFARERSRESKERYEKRRAEAANNSKSERKGKEGNVKSFKAEGLKDVSKLDEVRAGRCRDG